MSPSQEFTHWMRDHANKFRMYAPHEIALLAVSCGFSLYEVCPGVTDFASHIKKLLDFYDSPFAEKWARVRSYDMGKD